MSKRITKTQQVAGSRYLQVLTDHREEIDMLRQEAIQIRKRDTYPSFRWSRQHADAMADIDDLAADLLEMHDKTGISLDNWPVARHHPRDLHPPVRRRHRPPREGYGQRRPATVHHERDRQ